MTTHSYATVGRQLADRAAARDGFEPWLFFPRGWEWPWLSFEESQACVEAWAERLAELAGGEGSFCVLCAESVPETLLLRLAVATAGAGGKSRIGMASPKASLADASFAGLSFQSSPIRPRIEIEIEVGSLVAAESGRQAGRGEASESVDGAEPIHLDLPGRRRPVVLATGVLPPARLMSAVLEANAALVLEPAGSGLVPDLRLRPNVLFLHAGESESLVGALKHPDSHPKRSHKRLQAAIAGIRLVIVEDPLDLERIQGIDWWNPEVVSFVPPPGR
jgi:hypothetical protein